MDNRRNSLCIIWKPNWTMWWLSQALHDSLCHALNSMDITRENSVLVAKHSCEIPTDADFWGNPCPDIFK